MWPAFHSSFSRTSPSWTSPERIRSWTCSGVASWITGTPDARLVLRWVALTILAVASLYSSAWANPVARQIRAATPGFEEQPQSSPARTEFARLHQRSRRAMSVAVVFGLFALFLG